MQEMSVPAEVLQRIDALAAKVGATAEHLWPALVKYEFWSAANEFFVSAFFAVTTLVLLIAHRRSIASDVADMRKRSEHATFDMDEWSVHSVVTMAAMVISAIGLVISAASALGGCAALFSPEAAALKSLLGGK